MKMPRAYRDAHDLRAMQDLLVRGRKAGNDSYYIHRGDLLWWLYYPPLEGEFWEQIYLWDDPRQPERLLGWALISPDWVGMDVYLQPELRGSQAARDMYIWAEEQALKEARARCRKNIYALWVNHGDDVLCAHLNQRGFRLGRGMAHLRRDLDVIQPPAELPDGFVTRSCQGEGEVEARAKAQYGAFGSSASFEQYRQRFVNFMRSPAYEPERDIVVANPQGEICAFCVIWIDDVNRVGLFEPVGTHPDFQRKGLGRALLVEGMHRLAQRGMNRAIVSTFEDNLAGIKLYESVGFQLLHKLGTFEKDV